MKKYSYRILLIIGLLIASFTLDRSITYADPKSTEIIEIEQYQLAEMILHEFELEASTDLTQTTIYKIYNCDNKLVYVTYNNDDQRLRMLLNKSDLLTTIDNISYFKLSR